MRNAGIVSVPTEMGELSLMESSIIGYIADKAQLKFTLLCGNGMVSFKIPDENRFTGADKLFSSILLENAKRIEKK